MNLLYFPRDINFHAIIVAKQLIKHNILTHCLTCNFHHMSQYNSFPSVWRGLTEHRREHPVYSNVCCQKFNITRLRVIGIFKT